MTGDNSSRAGRRPVVALIATLDTKGPEIAFIRDRLNELGADGLIIDSGIINAPTVSADISREEVADASGRGLAAIQASGSRGSAVEQMQEGLRVLARQLFDAGRIDAALCIGGAEGAQLGAAFMHVLPIGVPKIIVSPSASGRREFYPFVGSSDVLVMHSVIDILGLNSLARSVFGNAAAAVVGMCRWGAARPHSDRPSVGITMLGQTTPGASIVADRLEAAGFETMIFHANGVGGPAMDGLARDGVLSGVIDFTLSELANSLFDGIHATSEDRMRGAVDAGIPLVVVPGSADFFNQGPLNTLRPEYRARQHYKHNPVATLVRVQADEMETLGRQLADRLAPATGPTSVMFPTQGLSLIGVAQGAISDPDADLAFHRGLSSALRPDIPISVLDTDINSREFAEAVAEEFIRLYSLKNPSGPPNGE